MRYGFMGMAMPLIMDKAVYAFLRDYGIDVTPAFKKKIRKEYKEIVARTTALGKGNSLTKILYIGCYMISFHKAAPDVIDEKCFEALVRYLCDEMIRRQKEDESAFSEKNILMTVGAAGGLNVILKTLLNPGDEVITFAPFFGEYRNYVRNYGGVLVTAVTDPETFLPVPAVLAEVITPRTKALIINTPNNPTGVVYPESLIIEIAKVLEEKQKEFGTSVYLISDEPYRELVYDGVTVPYLTKYYRNTVVGYSYSKSLSLPGERIGYLVLPDELTDADEIIPGAAAANRILGFVNAPSLIQKTVGRCLDAKVDVEIYNRNRELLYGKLTEYGFSCIKPQGAFYLFVKAPDGDDKAFVAAAKKHRILMVAGTGFGGPGYVRLAYCVSYDMIERSLPGFAALAQEYGLR